MKHVIQTTFDAPNGNCLAACVASIFEIPLIDVPNFIVPDFDEWQEKLNAWLKPRKLMAVCISSEAAPEAISIAAGQSPRDSSIQHAVVWHEGQMIHDPHPDGQGILTQDDWTYFVIRDPAKG